MRPCDRCFSRAALHYDARRIPEALAAYDEAEALGHAPDACAAGRWNCWMLLGCFERAWREGEAIASRGAHDPHRFWDGRPFSGKRVMLRCLHGLGDAIQFIRYAQELRRLCARLIVETHPQLVTLLRAVDGIDEVVTWSGPQPAWDQQIEIMELPRVFGATLDSIPARVPYIGVDRDRIERSARALRNSGAPKIGLHWASGPHDPARTIALAALAPVLREPGYSFYSLQHGPAGAEIESVREIRQLHETLVNTGEVADTAADICNLDLVITVDTMTAHLAGALGKPVWTMLPFRADWRWMLDRVDTPWYPTMRLFRQVSPGDWSGVIGRVAVELRAYRFFDCSGRTM